MLKTARIGHRQILSRKKKRYLFQRNDDKIKRYLDYFRVCGFPRADFLINQDWRQNRFKFLVISSPLTWPMIKRR